MNKILYWLARKDIMLRNIGENTWHVDILPVLVGLDSLTSHLCVSGIELLNTEHKDMKKVRL